MNKVFALMIICFGLFLTPQNASAAPKKYFWGAAPTTEVMTYFHRQSNNISNFSVILPLHCEYNDSTTGEYSLEISGDEVPNLLVSRRGAVDADFDFSDPFFSNPIQVHVDIQFHGKRATMIVVAVGIDSEQDCTGSVGITDIRRGARVQ